VSESSAVSDIRRRTYHSIAIGRSCYSWGTPRRTHMQMRWEEGYACMHRAVCSRQLRELQSVWSRFPSTGKEETRRHRSFVSCAQRCNPTSTWCFKLLPNWPVQTLSGYWLLWHQTGVGATILERIPTSRLNRTRRNLITTGLALQKWEGCISCSPVAVVELWHWRLRICKGRDEVPQATRPACDSHTF